MSRTSSCLKTLTLCLLACAGLASAQQPQPQQQTPPSDKPPKLERIEPGSDVPATTIPPKRGTQIEEHRDNAGQVTDVEVTAGGSHYHIKPNTQPGNAQPGDAQSAIRGTAQWQVLQFDLNGKKKAASEGAATGEAAATAAEVPPPPPPATK